MILNLVVMGKRLKIVIVLLVAMIIGMIVGFGYLALR